MQTAGLKAFVSYSHKDEPLRRALDAHLAGLASEGIIQFWNDRAIEAGSEWAKDIQTRLENADIILLLISADFIASPYCSGQEMREALERHEKGLAHVVPVILRPLDWHHAPFAKIQALPRDGRAVTSWPNQDEALTDVALGIRAAVNTLLKNRDGHGKDSEHHLAAEHHQEDASEGSPFRRIAVKIKRRDNETITVTVRMLSTAQIVECEIPFDATVESIIVELTASLLSPLGWEHIAATTRLSAIAWRSCSS